MLNNFIRGVATQIASSALRNVSNNLLGNNLSYNTGNGLVGQTHTILDRLNLPLIVRIILFP